MRTDCNYWPRLFRYLKSIDHVTRNVYILENVMTNEIDNQDIQEIIDVWILEGEAPLGDGEMRDIPKYPE